MIIKRCGVFADEVHSAVLCLMDVDVATPGDICPESSRVNMKSSLVRFKGLIDADRHALDVGMTMNECAFDTFVCRLRKTICCIFQNGKVNIDVCQEDPIHTMAHILVGDRGMFEIETKAGDRTKSAKLITAASKDVLNRAPKNGERAYRSIHLIHADHVYPLYLNLLCNGADGCRAANSIRESLLLPCGYRKMMSPYVMD